MPPSPGTDKFAERHGFDPADVRREVAELKEAIALMRLFPEEVEMHRQLDDITYNASLYNP